MKLSKRPDTKKCPGCEQTLARTEDNFYRNVNGWAARCKPCHNKYSIEWAKRNPAAVKKISRKVRLKRKYGLSVEEYDKMFEQQEGKCFLCGKEHTRRLLNVDHCHTSGKVRRLLCDRCNLAVGLLKDDAALASKISGYLNAF